MNRLPSAVSTALLCAVVAVGCVRPPNQGGDPPSGPFVEVAVSTGESCARREGGQVQCWGLRAEDDGYPGLYTGSAPYVVPQLNDAEQLALSDGWWCALRKGGSVACWGRANYNAFGAGGPNRVVVTPEAVDGLTDVTQVTATPTSSNYGEFACARRADATVWCWGANEGGQLGDGTTTDRSVPVQVRDLADVAHVRAGGGHVCVLRADGAVLCWGRFGAGNVPTPVAGLSDVVELAPGSSHNCARLQSGQVMCWGEGTSGQLGDGANRSSATPVAVQGLTDATQLAAGGSATCARRATGEVVCWGGNSNGVLGTGDLASHAVPTPLSGLVDAVQIAVSGSHACALRSDNTVVCWGWNFSGELGLDTTDNARYAPSEPVPL